MIIFHKRINELQEERGKSQHMTAKKIGITQAAYSNFLKGKRSPNADSLVKLAKYFKVSTDYLLGVTDTNGRSADNTKPMKIRVHAVIDFKPGKGYQISIKQR